MIEDRRNVLDHFKGVPTEEIKNILAAQRNNFSVLIDNRTKNLAAGTTVRSANCFLAKDIVFYGRRDYNRKPCVGAYLTENIEVVPNLTELDRYCRMHDVDVVLGIDNNLEDNSKRTYLHDFQWDKNIHYLICFGCEGTGLDPEILKWCDKTVEIKMLGSSRSLNLGCAASIVMYDYCAKTGAF